MNLKVEFCKLARENQITPQCLSYLVILITGHNSLTAPLLRQLECPNVENFVKETGVTFSHANFFRIFRKSL